MIRKRAHPQSGCTSKGFNNVVHFCSTGQYLVTPQPAHGTNCSCDHHTNANKKQDHQMDSRDKNHASNTNPNKTNGVEQV